MIFWKTIFVSALFINTTIFCSDASNIESSIINLKKTLWKRMIDKETGVMFDYAGINGEILVPTAEDCLNNKPNAIGWWSPIENGAFFNGLYLDALCTQWKISQSNELKDQIKKIVGGLLLLHDVSSQPGFIARGVSTDGKLHYALGSDDQTFPWFYGLWKYLNTDIPNKNETALIIKRMESVGRALKKTNWRMPCEKPFTFRGSFAGNKYQCCVRVLFINYILKIISNNNYWTQGFNEIIQEKFKQNLTRLDIIQMGDTELTDYNTWTHASTQAALSELVHIDTDTSRKKIYKKGLSKTAEKASKFIKIYKEYNNLIDIKYDGNWRALNKYWKKQNTVSEVLEVAKIQLIEWNKINPKIKYDKQFMMRPLFAAWIVSLSRDKDIIVNALPEIKNALLHYRWEKICYSTFFIGENIYATLLERNYLQYFAKTNLED